MTAEARWATVPTINSRQRKRLSQSSPDRRKPLYQAVFATPSTRRTARTAALLCIKDGKNIDPACGCGNFLIITYRELRRLELEVLKFKAANGQMIIDITSLLKVNVEQFYGIEYEDFTCQIATVGMWLMDHQMNIRASEQFGLYYVRLPLTQSATIVNGNALRTDWESIVSKRELSYILGNPPFVGARIMNETQKIDITNVVETDTTVSLRYENIADNLDYVAAWYFKAA